ncbi:hypothetical protein SAMN05421538_10863 [Paracoccus isoporae]|uniref:DUF484 domain-containing protein n=1 Tax=Paracoccus isoporae TaxID=591205 RepID=A0A1G7E2J7_9RHOB|nr:DUF484 family protein [Paracoccus isoporae]SDE57934.1 hypothetical protein SAMN05421538_10863 [Paracoccus isoporae]
MSETGLTAEQRQALMEDPSTILMDRDLMRAIVGAHEDGVGENVIDIRGRAMTALEARLDRLESAHETVIAAAYENQSGMNTIHRAVLSLLEPVDFDGFLDNLQGDLADILRVDTLVLVMETETKQGAPELGGPLTMVPHGTVAKSLAGGRRGQSSGEVVLRRVVAATVGLHGGPVSSEALIPLDLGPTRLPAMLLMGSAEPGRFSAAQGTDLLRFFGQAFRLVLLRWLDE